MKILIIGCGKVGYTLAQELDREGHDIVVVDNKASAIHQITDSIDVMGIIGNGASYTVLKEAGIEDASLLIAVTESDELNLLCCLFAEKAGNCETIARVRNLQYNDEINFIREKMGLSMTINPELEAAVEMSRLIRIPSAIKVDSFANGRVELLKFEIPEASILDNMLLINLNKMVKGQLLVCAVERDDQIFIPSGKFILQAHDKISFLASPKTATYFFKEIGIISHPIKDIIMVGGGTLGIYLASKLIKYGIKVTIIEQNLDKCSELSELFPEALIIHGNASDNNLLLEEGIEGTDAFASLTNLDELNILLSLYAHKVSSAKTFTKITRLAYDDIISEMPLGVIVNPKVITAERIIQHVRAMGNPKGSNVETLYKIISNKVEALEFRVRNNSSLIGIPLEKLNLKSELLVGCINRHGTIIIPDGKDTIQIGDTVIIVTTNTGLNDLSDILL
ncbi:MAG: Trk system potassium transporter TrkA [Clostridiales bacterium]|nr:Trk system potassium transporter TrkA [Clostridiales bacterium]